MNLYITRNGERLGPYSIEEATRLRALGQLTDADWAWCEGMKDWTPLGQIPGLPPVAAPHLPPPPPPAPMTTAPAAESSVLPARLLTAFVLFVFLYFVLFVVIFIVAVGIGGAISGMQASGVQHAQGFDEGYRVGQEAGRKFGQAYGRTIMGIDAIVTIFIAGGLAYVIAFSRLLPWCRPRTM